MFYTSQTGKSTCSDNWVFRTLLSSTPGFLPQRQLLLPNCYMCLQQYLMHVQINRLIFEGYIPICRSAMCVRTYPSKQTPGHHIINTTLIFFFFVNSYNNISLNYSIVLTYSTIPSYDTFHLEQPTGWGQEGVENNKRFQKTQWFYIPHPCTKSTNPGLVLCISG